LLFWFCFGLFLFLFLLLSVFYCFTVAADGYVICEQ
jgi:hypothetical protein